MTLEERMAPKGAIWICCACGKTSEDKYGIEGAHDRGWDESCMLNSQLVHKDTIRTDKYGQKAATLWNSQ